MLERALPAAERGPVDRFFVIEMEKAGSVWEAALDLMLARGWRVLGEVRA